MTWQVVIHFTFCDSNPVLVRPFIALEDGSFFWVLGGVLSHTLPSMLEELIPVAERERVLGATCDVS